MHTFCALRTSLRAVPGAALLGAVLAASAFAQTTIGPPATSAVAESERTVAEFSFPDSRYEGLPSHSAWYLIAAVDQ